LAPDDEGLPGAEESSTLTRLEESIERALQVGEETILAVVLTTGGMREFVLYTEVPQKIEAGVSSVRADFPAYQVQFYIEPDSKWDGYASFADALE
jgi:hypothetical protein